MNLRNLYLTSTWPQVPAIWNANNTEIQRAFDVVYNETTGVVIVPINTTGRVKGATGEFVTTVTDNLIVKKQWTNLYENTTTIDQDYYRAYSGGDVSTRDASIIGSTENPAFEYVNLSSAYVKIANDVSIAFKTSQLGQEFQILFDLSTGYFGEYNILLDPSIGGTYKTLQVSYDDASAAWIKLIAVEYDASWGTTWAIKQYGGTYSII